MDIKHWVQNMAHTKRVSALDILAFAIVFKRNEWEDMAVRSRAWPDLTKEKNILAPGEEWLFNGLLLESSSPCPDTQFPQLEWDGDLTKWRQKQSVNKTEVSVTGWTRKQSFFVLFPDSRQSPWPLQKALNSFSLHLPQQENIVASAQKATYAKANVLFENQIAAHIFIELLCLHVDKFLKSRELSLLLDLELVVSPISSTNKTQHVQKRRTMEDFRIESALKLPGLLFLGYRYGYKPTS